MKGFGTCCPLFLRGGSAHSPYTMTPKQKMFLRLFVLLALMLGLLVLAQYPPLYAYFSVEALQGLVKSAGNWGILLYFFVFLVGTLMSVPGAVFVIFALLTYGYWWGTLLSYVGAVGTAWINFELARLVGGQSLSEIKNERLQRALSRVERRPVATICWLRVFLLLSPVVNYALALTTIKRRQFVGANALAMVLPLCFIVGSTVLFRSDYVQEVVSGWIKETFSV